MLATTAYLVVLTWSYVSSQRRIVAARRARTSSATGSVPSGQGLLPNVGTRTLEGLLVPPIAIVRLFVCSFMPLTNFFQLALGNMMHSQSPPTDSFLFGIAIYVFSCTREYLTSKQRQIASGDAAIRSVLFLALLIGSMNLLVRSFYYSSPHY